MYKKDLHPQKGLITDLITCVDAKASLGEDDGKADVHDE
jgi:hypothetical protein